MKAKIRALSDRERVAARVALGASLKERRAWAEAFDGDAFEAWQGWTWGRQKFDLSIVTFDPPPARGALVMRLEAIEYVAAKRDPDGTARSVVYRHEHDAPFASVVSTVAGARELVPSVADPPLVAIRGAAVAGPTVFELGRLHALEGTAADGDRYYWRAPAGWLLVGCPRRDVMAIVRAGRRPAGPPLWIVRGKSRYTLTDRGIER